MNNRQRAAEIIRTWQARHRTEMDNNPDWAAQNLAGDLADAGTLAPDAPAPLTAANGNPVWRADSTLMVTRYPDGEIAMLLNPKQEARYTPQAARDQAALLLAAANYTEGWWRVGIDYYAHMPGERRPVIRWGGWGK